MRPAPKNILRILDANFNRSREGLRVCEEIFRFFLNDRVFQEKFKRARHRITALLKKMPVSRAALLSARDVRADGGRKFSRWEKSRAGLPDVFLANCQRAKESLRALEEFSKLLDAGLAGGFKKLRFEVYAIEKQALPRLEAICDHRPDLPGRRVAGGSGAPGHPRRRRGRAIAR